MTYYKSSYLERFRFSSYNKGHYRYIHMIIRVPRHPSISGVDRTEKKEGCDGSPNFSAGPSGRQKGKRGVSGFFPRRPKNFFPN